MKCIPGCTCNRHKGKHPPDCTCGNHTKPGKKCPLDCTCNRHKSPTPTYRTKHQRIPRFRGQVSDELCVKCIEKGVNKPAQQWAQVHGEDGTDPWADYVPMCVKCHHIYDKIYDRQHRTNGRFSRAPGPD